MKLPSVDAARRRMVAHTAALASEAVSLEEVDGRILRQEVRAMRDQPPFAASAMDGWAVRYADAQDRPADLVIVGESAAGSGWNGQLAPGQAIRISTGAPVPEGSDHIVIQEEATRSADHVTVGPLNGSSSFIRPRGGDFRCGDTLLNEGCQLDPWRVALAASAGFTDLQVSKPPRVVIASSGNEIVAAGVEPGPWQIYDSAAPGLASWFRARGCDVARLAPLLDDSEAVVAALADVECDLLVTIGGASVGDHDLLKPTLIALGLQMVVDGVAVRPGKPSWFGVLPDGRRVLGLPGNPVSAMVCAELFATDLLAAMMGAKVSPFKVLTARLLSAIEANGPREHFMRADIALGPGGELTALVKANQDSSLVSILATAGGLVRRLPGASSAEAGDVVEVVLLNRLAS